ncbi:hypothetical protein ACFL0S_12320 [Thermodesulfobacteriota bacterium]
MPNDYSVQLHDLISEKIKSADRHLAVAKDNQDTKMQSYWNGQLEELAWLRTYLKAHVDLKDFVYYQ